MGGDEFVLVLKDMVDEKELDIVAGRIIAALDQPIAYEGADCSVSASIGVTTSTQYVWPNLERMLRDADVALYRSKLSGRARATIHRAEDGPASGVA